MELSMKLSMKYCQLLSAHGFRFLCSFLQGIIPRFLFRMVKGQRRTDENSQEKWMPNGTKKYQTKSLMFTGSFYIYTI